MSISNRSQSISVIRWITESAPHFKCQRPNVKTLKLNVFSNVVCIIRSASTLETKNYWFNYFVLDCNFRLKNPYLFPWWVVVSQPPGE